jgi:hypothetical protein
MEVHRNKSLDDLDGEVWQKAIGFEDWYMISNYGRLKRVARKFTRVRNGLLLNECIELPEAIVISSTNYKGYVRNYIKYKDSKKPVTLHRMVAKAFIPNPNNYEQINHINGIKTDNRVENLEWCNQSHNQKHRYTHLGAKASGVFLEKCIEGKMVKVVRICTQTNNIEIYNGVSEAAKQNPGVHHPNISKVCLGKRPKCGGFKWMYLMDYEKLNENLKKKYGK